MIVEYIRCVLVEHDSNSLEGVTPHQSGIEKWGVSPDRIIHHGLR